MIKSCVILLTLFSLFQCIVQELTPHTSCQNGIASGRILRLSVNSRRNQSGDWVDTFTARTEYGNSSDKMDLDLTHSIFDCEGKRVIYIQGVSNAVPVAISAGLLTFHPRCGKNIAILNKGRTVQKLNVDDKYNSVVFTNRPLRDNEIFEVRMDKKNTKSIHALGIGIITRTANDVDILPEMHKSPYAWMYHHTNIYSNSNQIFANYGQNLDTLKVGDRVGVMRSEFGTLHFFINGVDQGPAASNIPSPVYGVFELWHEAVKATIVDSISSPSS